MRGYRLYIVLFACALIVACGFFLWAREREPQYKGRSLTGWLRRYESKDGEAAAAVRQIGTNAIPFLLKWMCYEPGQWRIRWRNAFCKWPQPLDRIGGLSEIGYAG